MRIMIGALALCLSVLSQRAHAESCSSDDLDQFPSWTLTATLQPIAQGSTQRWSEAMVKLQKLEALLAAEESGVSQNPFARLQKRLEQVRSRFDATPNTANELAVDELRPRLCGDVENAAGLPVPECAWQVLNGPPVKVPIIKADGWTCARQDRFAAYVRVAHAIVGGVHQAYVSAAAKALKQHDKAWQRLITRGYSQYPWEVLVNGAFVDANAWGPPANQLILAHAATGMGVSNVGKRHKRDSAAAAIVALEALGYVRYFKDFRYYAGAGLAGTLNNLDKDQLGAGPVLHMTGFSLGYSYGLDEDHDHTLYMLVDVTAAIDDGMLEKVAQKAMRQ